MGKLKKEVGEYLDTVGKKSLPINSILRHQDEQNTLNPPPRQK